MIVAGVMSGTSADGINVALVRFASDGAGRAKGPSPHKHLRATSRFWLTKNIRSLPDSTRNPGNDERGVGPRCGSGPAEFSSRRTVCRGSGEDCAQASREVDLVGCHGQTLYHQGMPERFLGRRLAATWQTGEAAVMAARLGVPVISDFRPADIAAGGKGAPLVPFSIIFFIAIMYRDAGTTACRAGLRRISVELRI